MSKTIGMLLKVMAFAIVAHVILVFTVKAAVPDRSITLAEIFRGSIPYWIVLLGVVIALAAFPQLATFLPGL
jgi:C4-dicarboxylate transporter, DctM subunit